MKKLVAFLSLAALLLYADSAHAYLDPGSGSIVLQVLLGGIAGVALVLKLFWHRILQIFGIKKKEEQEGPKNS